MIRYTISGKPVTEELERSIRSFAFDNLSLLQFEFREGFQEEFYEVEASKPKAQLVFGDRFRMDRQRWGGLSSAMVRVSKHLSKLSRTGCPVVVACWDDPDAMSPSPLLIGKEFKRLVAGFFNNIGYVEPRVDQQGNVQYPPKVHFLPSGNLSLCRCNPLLAKALQERRTTWCPLNFEAILRHSGGSFLCLIYGPYGVGKTYSFGTLPDPIALVNVESKDPREVLAPFVEAGKEIIVYEPESSPERIEDYFQEIMGQLERFLQLVREENR